jgi:hypothetical protein
MQSLKRKWQGFTGKPVPKKLRTSEPVNNPTVENENEATKNEPSAKNDEEETAVAVEEEQNQKPSNTIKTALKKARADQPPATAPPTAMPSHSNEKIDIDSMTVNDLRKELKKRQLATAGRKADLQTRMRKHLAEEMKLRENDAWASKHIVAVKETKSTQIKQVKISDDYGKSGVHRKDVNEMDVVMKDAPESTSVNMLNDSQQVVTVPVAKKTDMTGSKACVPFVESEAMAKEVAQPANWYPPIPLRKQAPKSALKASKYNPSAIASTPQLDDVEPTAEPIPSDLVNEETSSAAILTKASDSSTDSTNNSTSVPSTSFKGTQLQASVSKTEVSSTLAYTTPVESGFKTTKAGGSGSAMLLEKKKAMAAATEARKARLAEMRQKVCAVFTLFSFDC